MPGESRVRVVRRHAGGTSVFAHPDVLGLDVALPSRHALAHYDVVEAYRWIGEVWLHAIRSLRVDAQLVSIEEARSSPPVEDIIRHACFGSLSPYEVTARGRKLVGLAQVRRRHTVLWQSGIHLRFDAEGLAALLSDANRDDLANRLHGHAVGLNEVTPSPLSLKDVVRAFEESLVQLLGIELVPGQWTDEELTRATIVR